MDELILRSLQGLTSPEQEEELRRWRSSSPDHETRYRAMAEVWQGTAVAEPGPFRRPVPTLSELEGRARGSRPRRAGAGRTPHLLGWAAMVILALGLGAWGGRWLPSSSDPAPPQLTEVTTGPGEMATTVLSDGSVVRLAPRTRIQAALTPGERLVRVEGRVFLAVASDPARPFRVLTASGEATVPGTRFEVDVRDRDEMRLLVVEGRVAVRHGTDQVELQAGQLGTTRTDRATRVESVPDPAARLDWMGSFVAFESTPLSQVARELERMLGSPIRIVDPAVLDRTVTGAYTEEDMAYILESVCRAAAVTCRQAADTVRISG